MKTLDEFRGSLKGAAPPADIDHALQALWWAGKGDWDAAHKVVQAHEDNDRCNWVHAHLPADIAHKVRHAQRLHKDDMQRWAKILGAKGWHGWACPKEFGGPGWNAVQRHLFEEECALAGAPRIVPFGPVMVAPVIIG